MLNIDKIAKLCYSGLVLNREEDVTIRYSKHDIVPSGYLPL